MVKAFGRTHRNNIITSGMNTTRSRDSISSLEKNEVKAKRPSMWNDYTSMEFVVCVLTLYFTDQQKTLSP